MKLKDHPLVCMYNFKKVKQTTLKITFKKSYKYQVLPSFVKYFL